MKILLCYAPFCTPASPPYSLAFLHSVLKPNKNLDIESIDLNLEFHKAKFSKYQKYYKSFSKNYNAEKYEKTSKEFRQESSYIYSKNNKLVIENNKPELFNELLKQITEKNPTLLLSALFIQARRSIHTHYAMN